MVPQHLDLETSGVYVTLAGAVVSVLRVSPTQRLYLGDNGLVYSQAGQVIRPQRRHRLVGQDLIRDTATLGQDDGSIDIRWSVCRSEFLRTDCYHGLVAMAEAYTLDDAAISTEIDRFLSSIPISAGSGIAS